MKKTIIVLVGFSIGAGATALLGSVTQDAPKDDVREILIRMERRQIPEVHPRIFKHGYIHGICDSDEACRLIDGAKPMSDGELSAFFADIERLRGKETRSRLERLTTKRHELEK